MGFAAEAEPPARPQLVFALGGAIRVERFALHTCLHGYQIGRYLGSHLHEMPFRLVELFRVGGVGGRLVEHAHDAGCGISSEFPGSQPFCHVGMRCREGRADE